MERNEISIHETRAFLDFLKSKGRWITHDADAPAAPGGGRVSVVEALRDAGGSGGSGWDDIDDPEKYLEEDQKARKLAAAAGMQGLDLPMRHPDKRIDARIRKEMG